DMVETMYEASGLGLAAPQVGVEKRLFVYDVGDGPAVVVNPVLAESSGEWPYEEGCLSIPELRWEVVRPKEGLLRGVDLDGNELAIEADELLARCFQHEIDHLDGILLLERITPDEAREARRILRARALAADPLGIGAP